ncbi:MAG: hypothetical protein CFE22_10595 [Cytophagaceae bacterium BCCC1]|nr:MAG: hypothetical protein CFE22_10595 [Cytophagaceae bacterium BCCC1]
MLAPIVGITSVFLIFFLFSFLQNKHNLKSKIEIIGEIENFVKIKLKNCNVESSTLGAKNSAFLINKADIYFSEDSIFIFGYSPTFSSKSYSCPIILTNDFDEVSLRFRKAIVKKPLRINLNSYNKDIFIEFGDAIWLSTNVSLRIKGIDEEIKSKIQELELMKR